MKKNEHPGLFVVLEGLDGCGLTTQSVRLVEYFSRKGTKAYLTKEPTDNVIGGLIRGALSHVYKLPPEVLQLLFAADRGHHLNREIIPLLKKKRIIVCDRYFWSTVAFGSLNLDFKWLLEINQHFIFPDIIILLKVPPELCVKRIRRNRFDFELFEKLEQLKKVWKTYEWLEEKYKNKRVVIVDGVGKIEEVEARILAAVSGSPKAKRLLGKHVRTSDK